MITRARGTITTIQNQNIQIPCTVRGVLRPIIIWKRKNGQRLRGRVISRNTRNDETTSTLIISRVQTRDAGVYTCTATNKVTARPIEQEVTLVIQGIVAHFR